MWNSELLFKIIGLYSVISFKVSVQEKLVSLKFVQGYLSIYYIILKMYKYFVDKGNNEIKKI